MQCELTGKVKKVCEVQKFQSGFQKRSVVVVESNAKSKFENILAVDFTKDRVEMLDGIRIGDEVKISANIDGREWTDPKSGNVRYFTSLTGFKISVAGGDRKMPEPATPPADMGEDLDSSEMPF